LPEERKDFFFEKKKQKTFISFGPQVVKPAWSKLQKFFLLLFCSQKRRRFPYPKLPSSYHTAKPDSLAQTKAKRRAKGANSHAAQPVAGGPDGWFDRSTMPHRGRVDRVIRSQ
jgi:hypothetical protein